jgi:hypothetical protein
MFDKKPISEDFVVLNNKDKIYFYELTKGILDKVTNKSTIFGNKINNSKFISLMEKELLKYPNRKIKNLPLVDHDKIRKKTREILKRHKILTVETEQKNPKKFADEDISWFNKTANKQRGMFK